MIINKIKNKERTKHNKKTQKFRNFNKNTILMSINFDNYNLYLKYLILLIELVKNNIYLVTFETYFHSIFTEVKQVISKVSYIKKRFFNPKF